MKTIKQIIDACGRCIEWDKGLESCHGCPYEKETYCARKLTNDVIFQLQRLDESEGADYFRIERSSNGKVKNMFPIDHDEYVLYVKNLDSIDIEGESNEQPTLPGFEKEISHNKSENV